MRQSQKTAKIGNTGPLLTHIRPSMAESVSDFELRAKRGAKFTSVRWDSPAGTTPRVNLRGRLQEKGRTIMLPEWICTGPDLIYWGLQMKIYLTFIIMACL